MCRSHTGGASPPPAGHFLLAGLAWERSPEPRLGQGPRPGWELLPGVGLQAGTIFPEGHPRGALQRWAWHLWLGSGLCLPPAIAVETSLGEGAEPAAGKAKPHQGKRSQRGH